MLIQGVPVTSIQGVPLCISGGPLLNFQCKFQRVPTGGPPLLRACHVPGKVGKVAADLSK